MANRFNSLKKGISKVKNISPKIKGNSNQNSSKNKSKDSKSRSSIEYIVPENSPLRKNSPDESGFYNSDYSDYSDGSSDFNDSVDLNSDGSKNFIDSVDLNSDDSNNLIVSDDSEALDNMDYLEDSNMDDLDEIDRKYSRYIFGDDLNDETYSNPRDSRFKEGFNNYDLEDDYDGRFTGNDGSKKKFRKNPADDFNKNYFNNDFGNNNDLDNNDKTFKNNSYLDENYSDFRYDDGLMNGLDENYSDFRYDDGLMNGLDNLNEDFLDSKEKQRNKLKSSNINSKLLDFKNKILNKDDKSKNRFGKIVFILIIAVLVLSIFYFFVYQPFQDELNLERNAKLNELNTLYKGPLEAHENAYTLKSQIESENNLDELKLIDIMMYATKDWRNYHSSKIVSCKDNFGRVMLVYGEDNKNVIMSVKDANEFVKDNDARVLSNIQFGKVDTTIVPISISRLQATAGLISVGSIVDIYSLSDNYSYPYGESDDLSDSGSVSDSEGLNESEYDSGSSDNSDDQLSEESENNDDAGDLESNEENLSRTMVDSDVENQEFSASAEPDVSGATVLAILRSKDSGMIDSSISKSNTLVDGNTTTPYENTSSYSNDVEELLKASVFNSYDNSNALESYLDSYGIKLSNYERMSNLADLDSEYLVLLEVPRSDVSFVINNMDNLILTIPTEFAPNWVISELNETYYDNIYNYDSNSFLLEFN